MAPYDETQVSNADRRLDRRWSVSLMTAFVAPTGTHSKRFFKAMTRDLSDHGAFLYSIARPAVGEDLMLAVSAQVPDEKLGPRLLKTILPCRVLRVTEESPAGIALRFKKCDDPILQKILHYVRSTAEAYPHMPDPLKTRTLLKPLITNTISVFQSMMSVEPKLQEYLPPFEVPHHWQEVTGIVYFVREAPQGAILFSFPKNLIHYLASRFYREDHLKPDALRDWVKEITNFIVGKALAESGEQSPELRMALPDVILGRNGLKGLDRFPDCQGARLLLQGEFFTIAICMMPGLGGGAPATAVTHPSTP